MLIAGGFVKLDAVLPNPSAIDLGVFSVRDFLLSVKAPVYVTCAGPVDDPKCKSCFRTNSNLIFRIVRDREAWEKEHPGQAVPLIDNWWKLGEANRTLLHALVRA